MKNYGRKLFAPDVKETPIVGHQGGTVYEMSLKEKVVNMLCLGLIQGTYYEDSAEIIQKTKDIYTEAVKTCPSFLAKAAVYAREKVGMKLQPNIALVYLSTLSDKRLFRAAFDHVIKTPKDLFDFMELCRKGDIRTGIGRGVKNTVNRWLVSRMTEYHACRYGGKIAEVMKVTRPIPTDETKDIFEYVVKGNISVNLKRANALKFVITQLNEGNVNSIVLDTIQKFGLQMEELKHTFGSLSQDQRQDVYRFFIPKLAFMATVMNLVAIERVFDGKVPKDIVQIVVDKLSDVESYRKSRMLPFKLITARNMTNVREWQRAIERLVTAGIKGVFDVPADVKTLVAVDTSGSMRGSMLTPSLDCADVASLFGAMCTLGIEGSDAYAVASSMKGVRVMTDEVFTLAKEIYDLNVGCGTYFGQIMEHYNRHKYVILITDSELADHLESEWARVKKPQGAKLIVWQLQPYWHKVSDRKDVLYFQGYSDALIGTIRNIMEGKGQLADIEAVKL